MLSVSLNNTFPSFVSFFFVFLLFLPDENKPPVANAGGDKIVYLPLTLISLDGAQSHDDRGITTYQWTRDQNSLAAGVSPLWFKGGNVDTMFLPVNANLINSNNIK